MIAGKLSDAFEATIRLPLFDSTQTQVVVDAVIDTGFNGFLTLPPSLIAKLDLQCIGRGRAVLADGTEVVFDVFEAFLLWDGTAISVEADSAKTDVLIGMSLLRGYELWINAVKGGEVRIAPGRELKTQHES